jgi:hypothetical protein
MRNYTSKEVRQCHLDSLGRHPHSGDTVREQIERSRSQLASSKAILQRSAPHVRRKQPDFAVAPAPLRASVLVLLAEVNARMSDLKRLRRAAGTSQLAAIDAELQQLRRLHQIKRALGET